MADGYLLSENDRRVLKEVVRDYETRRGNVSSRSEQGTPSAAPEVYVARVPSDGIPALDEGFTGTGTGTGTADDSPGYAVCAVYRVVLDGTGTPTLIRVGDLNKVIYNLSTRTVSGGGWILTTRDKFGYWFAGGAVDLEDDGAGATGTKIVDHVHVVESIADTGTGTAGAPSWYCERVVLPPTGWPPIAQPTVQYLDVRESENRYPRIMDAEGATPTHIIPLYEDERGNRYIVFWKTDTSDTVELTTGFTISQDPATCTITATPVLGTYTISLEVTSPTDPRTGLTLRIT